MPTLPKRPGLFYLLAVLECCLAGLASLAMPGRITIYKLLLAASLLATGALLVIVWRRGLPSSKWLESLKTRLRGAEGQLLVALIPPALTAILLMRGARPDIILQSAPGLACVWLICVEFLYFFPHIENPAPSGHMHSREKWAAAITVAGLYIILALRTPLSGSLDGLPWNSLLEFVLAACLLPLAVLLNPRFFAPKPVLLLSGLLLALRFYACLILPQTGLEVQLASGEHATPQKSYASLLDPGLADLMRVPYQSPREFPIEWINSPSENLSSFWVRLDFTGYLQLGRDESPLIFAQGITDGQAEITNLQTGLAQKVPISTLDHPSKLDGNGLQPGKYRLQGWLVFKHYANQQFDLATSSADGVITPALGADRVWRSASGLELSPLAIDFLEVFDALTMIWILGLVTLAILDGLRRLSGAGILQPVDLFLAGSGTFFLVVAVAFQRRDFENLIPFVIAGFGLVKLAFLIRRPNHRYHWLEFLVALGIPLLIMFLCLDAGDLRSVAVFPQGQDNIEYQTLARNIFVEGDFLLLNHSARAYKILFPYLVGLEHLLFGQSVAAQLFLNSWCALFNVLLLGQIPISTRIPRAGPYLLSLTALLILCLPSFYIFYFRFGLMEPAAVLLLIATLWLASRKQLVGMTLTGILTVLMRLDYIGLVFAAALLTCPPLTGNLMGCLSSLRAWLASCWAKLAGYGLALILPPGLIVLAYIWLIPGYMLNASDTRPSSLATVLEGLLRIILGGSLEELRVRFAANPLDMILISLPLLAGTVLGVLSLLRLRPFHEIDARWGLLMIAFLLVYCVVLPTGYSPRFSTPLLPLALIVLCESVNFSRK